MDVNKDTGEPKDPLGRKVDVAPDDGKDYMLQVTWFFRSVLWCILSMMMPC